MGLRKWTMKQYWRLTQVRGIWNLFYGVLLLAIAYYAYIPFFYDMGVWGPFAFAGVMFIVFLITGYIYDRILVMWGPQQEVLIERNPFSYVAQPMDRIFWFPVYSTLLNAAQDLAEDMELDTTVLDETREYFAQLQTFGPLRCSDIDEAIDLRRQFVRDHPFSNLVDGKGDDEGVNIE